MKSEAEVLYLEAAHAEMLRDVIKEYSRETGVLVDSIRIDETTGNMYIVTVEPTVLPCLFNIFVRYGRRFERERGDMIKVEVSGGVAWSDDPRVDIIDHDNNEAEREAKER